jgi:phosphoribosylanthranilate isomerase
MRPQDVNAALNEGADALGFVVDSPSSPRNLTLPHAKRLMKTAHLFSTRVAVTSVRDSRRVLRICAELKPDALQLHYHTPELIHSLRKEHTATRLILATPIHDNSSLRRARNLSHYSDAVVADSPSPTRMGGTGRTHDWHITARIRNAIYPHPLILAGGLTAKNVKAAIEQVKPFAVDVSSGVEKEVGIKDHGKIREFIMNAKGKVA